MVRIHLPNAKYTLAEVTFARQKSGIKSESGMLAQRVARFVFDSAGNDSSGVSNSTIATHGTGVFLPIGAKITRVWYQVKTGFTSAGSTATLAFQANAAGDLLAAVAVSGNPGTPGIYAGIPDDTVSNIKTCTAEREISVAVAVQVLTAGRLVGFAEFVIDE